MNRTDVNAPAGRMRAGPLPARILPFALYMAFVAVVPAIGSLWPAFDIRWLYPVKVAVVAGALVLYWPAYRELADCRLTAAEVLVALASGLAVFVAWINLDLPGISLMAADAAGFDPRAADGAIVWPLAAMRLGGAALVVPVMEELFWRSLVMRWIDCHDFLGLEPRAISRRALLAASVVFGLEHHLWLAGILAGLVYGELYRRSGKLWLPVLGHAVTNGALGLWVLSTGDWRFW